MLGEQPTTGQGAYQSHAWLQRGNLIIDITADQFPEVEDPVIVTTRSPWHEQFEGEPQHVADYRIYDDFTVARLHAAYTKIVSRIHPAA